MFVILSASGIISILVAFNLIRNRRCFNKFAMLPTKFSGSYSSSNEPTSYSYAETEKTYMTPSYMIMIPKGTLSYGGSKKAKFQRQSQSPVTQTPLNESSSPSFPSSGHSGRQHIDLTTLLSDASRFHQPCPFMPLEQFSEIGPCNFHNTLNMEEEYTDLDYPIKCENPTPLICQSFAEDQKSQPLRTATVQNFLFNGSSTLDRSTLTNGRNKPRIKSPPDFPPPRIPH